ncbi:MAG: hypothetical protein LBT11_02865 [Treponema sp.]|nr:hypothetical protein [Treponema sp.]
MKRRFRGIILPLLLLFGSCGIDDYPYMEPVPQANISRPGGYGVEIRLPGSPGSNFRHFTIFYRIYVSSIPLPLPVPGDASIINQTLYSDYVALYQYTTNTVDTTNIASQFYSRHYYSLDLEGVDIDSELNSSSLGKTISLDFDPNQTPSMNLNLSGSSTGEIRLLRSDGRSASEGIFTPVPSDRYLLNSSGLYTNNNNSAQNADVAYTGSSGEVRYTYVSMYILAAGIDTNYSPVYSQPTFIGIFLLPDLH